MLIYYRDDKVYTDLFWYGVGTLLLYMLTLILLTILLHSRSPVPAQLIQAKNKFYRESAYVRLYIAHRFKQGRTHRAAVYSPELYVWRAILVLSNSVV